MKEPTDEEIDVLLGALDTAARDVDNYAFGLPLNAEDLQVFRIIVRAWLRTTQEGQQAHQKGEAVE